MNYKRTLFLALIFFWCSFIYADMTAYQIVDKAYNVDDGKDMKSKLVMKIISSSKRVKTRNLKFYRKDFGRDSRSLIVFTAPADVKGTSFLTWNNRDRDNDQWLYLPAAKVIKRIGSGSQSKSFMGSHFSYEDLGNRSIKKDTFKVMPSKKVDGYDCYVIEAIAKNKKESYVKRIYHIRKDNFIIIKSDLYGKDGKLAKVFTASNIKKINNVWTILSFKMKDVKKGGYSTMEFSQVSYNSGLMSRLFHVQSLKK